MSTLIISWRINNLLRESKAGAIGFAGILFLLCLGFLSPVVFKLQPYLLSDNLLDNPSWSLFGPAHFFGTDDLGRDIFSRLVAGARYSLSIGFAVVFCSALIGATLGMFAGVYGGWVDAVIMRLVDIVMSLPSILLAIVMVAVLGPGLLNAMIAVSIVSIPRFVRIMRSVAATEMKKQYVLAAQSNGASRFRILYSEVLPNCWAPLIIQATLGFSDAILDIAALGFLGLGARPPSAEWGVMLSDARPYIESDPYMVILPGLCILITVLSFNLVGDALRDWLDPKTGNVK